MYDWQRSDEGSRAKVLEERRSAILEQLEEGSSPAIQESLLVEWLELVKARDRLLREEVHEANERMKLECLVDLRRVLKDLGGLTASSDHEDATLRRDLASLYHQVESFCEVNSIAMEQSTRVNGEVPKAPEKVPPAVVFCPPPAPPPLPPPPPVESLNLRKRGAVAVAKEDNTESATPESNEDCDADAPAAKKVKTPSKSATFSQQTPFRHESPLQHFNKHLIMSISGGLVKRQLKRTVGARSPGGTPVRRERVLDASDPADAIAMALQRKFQNVPVRSPLTPCDESRADDSNVSDAFCSPMLSTSTAKVPIASQSPAQSPAVKENINEVGLVQTL